jgi:tRNA-dihydrouridine synthase C
VIKSREPWDYKAFWESGDRIVLAPMEGVVDRVMRELLTKSGGIDLGVTEFIRVTDRLLPESEFYKDCPELRTGGRTSLGIPVLVQLLGGQPGPMGENAARAGELGAHGIDLNFGCPAKTVNRHDGGASLLKIPERVYEVTSAVRRATPSHLPVSAKVRLGFSDKVFHREIAQAAERGGAEWLTVHARTRDEGYRPPAHWEYIANMREAVGITVVANGDIWTVDDYHRARQVSGCRHVMIGRGLLSDPDLASVIRGTSEATWQGVLPRLLDFTDASFQERGERYALPRLKQWLKSLARRHPEALHLFETLKRFESYDMALESVHTMCETHDVLVIRTDRGSHGSQSPNLQQELLPVL